MLQRVALRVVVTRRASLENHRLRLKEGKQTLTPALAAEPGLLEAAKGNTEVSAEGVVADRSGAQLPGHVAGPVNIVREH